MAKPVYTVTIVVGPDSDFEAEAIRQVLEGFNVRVLKYPIGRPLDFIDFISGNDYPIKSDFIIFSFHGEAGRFLMPSLEASLYQPKEPTENLGPEEIERNFHLKDTCIINTGCTLGEQKMATAFLNKGCKIYIGAVDYVEGNSSLFFVIRFFYELINNHLDPSEAFKTACATDAETRLFKIYRG